MTSLFPPIEPYASGMLDVGDGNLVHWETSGNPDGKPALVVHDGPGAGTRPEQRRLFDPDRYRIVLLDQRGSGRSTPSAADPATAMRHNKTWTLADDVERLREHLGIEQWLLYGEGWGSTLALAYAEAHPERVTEIVLSRVTTSRRAETDWTYRGLNRFFPGEWQEFLDAVGAGPYDDVVRAYERLTQDESPAVRERAVRAWSRWHDTVGTAGGTRQEAALLGERPPTEQTAVARTSARYHTSGAWIGEGALIRDAAKLAGIPGILIHGRLDLANPPVTAWELAQAWPGAELRIVDGPGDPASDESLALAAESISRFAMASSTDHAGTRT
ncbi:prolyl aminopeptidase [Streptomyces sp. NPDC005480]|uniref:prolyl aminopeptidase n=1 Tax=Streptomyces sp. NPDC005480 TaxID=3154880 RepID=UPI0033BF1482